MRHCTILAATTTVAAALVAVVSTMSAAPAAQAATPGPTLRLIAAQNSITVGKFRNQPVSLDPGIWLESLGTALRFDVRRASLTKPMTITQIIRTALGKVERRRLPGTLLDSWNGLKDFARFTVRNSKGKLVASLSVTFCTDSYDSQRVSAASAPASPYPQQCALDPFQLATVWGIQRGWAVDPAQSSSLPDFSLALGRYHVTETITGRYIRLFRIPADFATATVAVTVVNANSSGATGRGSSPSQLKAPSQLGALPNVRYLARPPRAALPDLVAQPSWGISTSHTRSGHDLLDFGATVWIGGNSPLDVEGFRVPGSLVMKAYQYFWRNGRIIGRVRAGTMGFDNKKGHHHWHFQQFAVYRLLNASKNLAVRSHKDGFCIAPTDSVDLLLPHAIWQPSEIGLGGQCGVATALWVQEYLPVGWGDTYAQYVAGQAFDITNLQNGTYYIEIITNPLRKLHELTFANDTSLRKVILGGSPGNRTVRVPAWHGIDPES
jgi:Lysyl oxidase